MRALPILVLALLVAFVPIRFAGGVEDVSVVIQGPATIAPSSTHAYSIAVTGGYAADGNGTFEISYVLQGEHLSGGDPQIARTLANKEGTFSVNITAPSSEGTVLLYVQAKSSGEGGNATGDTSLAIEVYRPVELRVFLKNNGAAAALNVTASFYVDGVFVGNCTVARIEAGGQAEANVTYIPVRLAVGRHVVKVTADLDRDGVIEPDRGELLVSEFFYKTETSNWPVIFGIVTVFIAVVLLFLVLAIRRQRRLG